MSLTSLQVEEDCGGPPYLSVLFTPSPVRRYCVYYHPLLSDTLELGKELGDELVIFLG